MHISEFPNSTNPYDSITEAYHLNGNNNLALLNYRKSLELNPNNLKAIEMIKKIDKKQTGYNNVYNQLLDYRLLGNSYGISSDSFLFTNLVLANATNHTRTRWQ